MMTVVDMPPTVWIAHTPASEAFQGTQLFSADCVPRSKLITLPAHFPEEKASSQVCPRLRASCAGRVWEQICQVACFLGPTPLLGQSWHPPSSTRHPLHSNLLQAEDKEVWASGGKWPGWTLGQDRAGAHHPPPGLPGKCQCLILAPEDTLS